MLPSLGLILLCQLIGEAVARGPLRNDGVETASKGPLAVTLLVR